MPKEVSSLLSLCTVIYSVCQCLVLPQWTPHFPSLPLTAKALSVMVSVSVSGSVFSTLCSLNYGWGSISGQEKIYDYPVITYFFLQGKREMCILEKREQDKDRNLDNVFICSVSLFIQRPFCWASTVCQVTFWELKLVQWTKPMGVFLWRKLGIGQ